MSKYEIEKELITLCANFFQHTGINMNIIKYVNFVDDLGMDSVLFITLIIEIETRFGIAIPDRLLNIENFNNINNIIDIVSAEISSEQIKGNKTNG